jgi:hypothetical protein
MWKLWKCGSLLRTDSSGERKCMTGGAMAWSLHHNGLCLIIVKADAHDPTGFSPWLHGNFSDSTIMRDSLHETYWALQQWKLLVYQ